MDQERAGNHLVPPELQPELTQFAMDNAFVSIFWVGRDARIYYANNHACKTLGYSRSEFLRLNIPDIDPNYPMEQWDDHWQILKRDGSLSFETLHRHKNGAAIPVWVVANYVHLDGYEYNVGFARDISEQKRTEAALREQEEFFRLIAENVDDFIAVLDLSGRRLYNNRAYADLFGSPDGLKGTVSFNEVHPDDRERIEQLFHRTVQTGVGHRAEFRFVLPDGSIRNMESAGGLIRDSRGAAMRVVVVSRDITERKRAEDVIHDMAFHDALTKLPNRRLLQDRMEQMMAMSQRSGLYNALIFLDMDNFKPLNDEQGHDAGDALLVEAARRLKSSVREMDTVARFGGDEFMVLLDALDTDKAKAAREAATVAEKIRTALAAPYRITVRRKGQPETTIEHRCTSSIGVTLFADHKTAAEDVIGAADKAMYHAKEAGGNRVHFQG